MQTAKITAFVFGLALVSSACGDSMSALNPTAPSSLSPDVVNVEAGANGAAGAMGNGPKPGNGNGNANGNANGNGNGNGNGQTPSLTSGTVETRVQFEGTIGVKGDSSITVNNQVINVTTQTVIRKGDLRYEFSALLKGDRVHVDAMRRDNNGVVSVEAREIKLQNPGDGETLPPPPPPPPAPTGTLSVEAVDNAAEEGSSDTGKFRITRSGALVAEELQNLPFTLGGTATQGADYSVSTPVNFGAGVEEAFVVVTALADSLSDSGETVTLTLAAFGSYTVGPNASATVTITEPPAPPPLPAVSIVAQADTIALDPSLGFAEGAFVLSRSGDPSAALTVTFSVGGTAFVADNGTTATFPANQRQVIVRFAVVSTGTVIMTVEDRDAYNPGSPASATVTVQ